MGDDLFFRQFWTKTRHILIVQIATTALWGAILGLTVVLLMLR